MRAEKGLRTSPFPSPEVLGLEIWGFLPTAPCARQEGYFIPRRLVLRIPVMLAIFRLIARLLSKQDS